MGPIKQYENDKFLVNIDIDQFSESPRDWDNIATIVEWHKRLDIGDRKVAAGVYDSEIDVLDAEVLDLEDVYYRPLYIYQHSGITVSTTPFSSMWDSGQVGWVYVEGAKARGLGFDEEKVYEIIESEVRVLDDYVTGNIYTCAVYEKEKCGECNHVHNVLYDSMSGLYGEQGIKDFIEEVRHKLGDEFTDEIISDL